MEADSPNMPQLSERIDQLRKTLAKYPASPENQSLLSLHIYEILKGYRMYVSYFEELLTLRQDPEDEREQFLDTLSKIDVLLDDMQYHLAELRVQIDKFLDSAEPDP